MILIITNKADPHVDVVLEELEKRGEKVIRFNTEDFPQNISCNWEVSLNKIDGELNFAGNRQIKLSDVSSCWYRRPDPPVIDSKISQPQARQFAKDETEAFLKNLWVYLSDRFWISYPLKLRQAESKIFNLKLASKLGFYVPKTLVTNDPEETRRFFDGCHGYIINKVLGRGQIEYQKDYFTVYTHKVTLQDLGNLKEIKYTPCLFQEYIPKQIEIRVTVVGNKVFACEIYSQENKRTKDDWRHYNFDRTEMKYRARGYRHIFTEYGHLAQNMYLICAALGLGICSIGGFIDDGLNKILDIDGRIESVIGVIAIGNKI